MKAVVYDKQSGPDHLVLRDVDTPVPDSHGVLVKVFAASVNAADYRSMQMGLIPKRKIFGADVAGVVDAVGPEVTAFTPGDRVFGDLSNHGFGGFAEYVAAPAKALARLPDGLPFTDAACLPLAGTTALKAIRRGPPIAPGTKVLVAGSGGGVGTLAVQLARHMGGEVTAVCGPANVDNARTAGADRVIDYTAQDFARVGTAWDTILAVNGNRSLFTYRQALAPGGTCVVVGGSLSQIFASLLFGWALSLGSRKIRTLTAKSDGETLQTLAELSAAGALRPVIDRVCTLEQLPESVTYASRGHARGKIVVRMAGDH